MDLSNLSLAELRALGPKIKAEISRREGEEMARARQQILAIAQGVGIPLKDLIAAGGKGGGKSVGVPKGTKVAVRYRHPENATLMWTGRGRQPKWVAAWVAAGGEMAQLLINAD